MFFYTAAWICWRCVGVAGTTSYATCIQNHEMCSKLSELFTWQRTPSGFTGSTGKHFPFDSSTDIPWTWHSRSFSCILEFGEKVSCFLWLIRRNIDDFISICAGIFYQNFSLVIRRFPTISSRSLASGEGWAQELSSEGTFNDESCTDLLVPRFCCLLFSCFSPILPWSCQCARDVDSVDRHARTASKS